MYVVSFVCDFYVIVYMEEYVMICALCFVDGLCTGCMLGILSQADRLSQVHIVVDLGRCFGFGGVDSLFISDPRQA